MFKEYLQINKFKSEQREYIKNYTVPPAHG